MNKIEIYGYSIIAVLLPNVIFLIIILRDMYKTGTSYGRKIPKPPEHLRPKKGSVPHMRNPPPPPEKRCGHGFKIKDVMNQEIDPCCKYCGMKLSVLSDHLKKGYEIKSAESKNTTHELKIKRIYVVEYYAGNKPWELRKNDRNFKVGDTINFTIIENGLKYSRDIIYIFEGGEYGLEKGYCILTLSGYKYCL